MKTRGICGQTNTPLFNLVRWRGVNRHVSEENRHRKPPQESSTLSGQWVTSSAQGPGLSTETKAHLRGCLKKQLDKGYSLKSAMLLFSPSPMAITSQWPTQSYILKGNHYPSEWYFTHHPLIQQMVLGLKLETLCLINNGLTVYIFLDPNGASTEVVCWLLSLRSYEMTCV